MKTDNAGHYREMNPNQNYESVYNGVKMYYDAEMPQIMPLVNKALPAVDIGSGYGYIAKYLLDKGFYDITCVDISSGLLEIIGSWLGSSVKTVNMDGLQFLQSACNTTHYPPPLKIKHFVNLPVLG